MAKGLPWILMGSKEVESRKEALKPERFIKKRGAQRFFIDLLYEFD
jgi:hypothetical protein